MIGLHREFTRSATLVRRDEALRQVFGMVGVPLTRYSVGQVVPRSEIERARAEGRIHYDNRCFTAEELQILGHRFLAHGRGIDEEHDYQVDGSLQPIESYFPPVDEHGYFAGSWVLGTHIGDDDAWTGVLTSEFNGYSVSLLAVEEEAEIVVEDDQPGADGQKARDGHRVLHEDTVGYDTFLWDRLVIAGDLALSCGHGLDPPYHYREG